MHKPRLRLVVDCDCVEGLEEDCDACKLETLERGIEEAMLKAEEGEGPED